MTDRVKALTVILEQDMRDDDVQVIIDAIRLIRHVARVEPLIVTAEDHLARARVKQELLQQIIDILK